jgi:Protein of unknown function (DUF2877)
MTAGAVTGWKIVRIGPVAAEILAHDGEAEVAAVFERSIVVMTQFGFVTLGGEQIGDGPLNVLLTPSPGPLDWVRLGLTRDAKGAVAGGRLHVGDTFALESATAPVWAPPPWPEFSRTRVAASVAFVRAHDVSFWPSEGLSRLVLAGAPDRSDRTARAAAPTVATLAKALPPALAARATNDDLLRAATLLVGLGPGLTPSGDDLLGGLCLTLSALGQTRVREALWDALAPEMDVLTTGLSGAHLAAAADGLAAASVHAAVSALLMHDAATLPGHMETLRGIGHSSGCDTLAGIVLALEAALAAGVLT